MDEKGNRLSEYKIDKVIARVDELETRVTEIEKGYIAIGSKINHLIDSVDEVKGDVKELMNEKKKGPDKFMWLVIGSTVSGIVAFVISSML